ncbi:RNA12 protein-domain-containing protein [Mycena albidolilacea]|uniref:Mitochondrial escape protein 2 n=1 Tax=Mycena albidolilacea TaxID=1033008 RepID=A0AAD7F509_9AGAR|nr:RNA12 protein-domain-containing protein [Mycena albidolilacea]
MLCLECGKLSVRWHFARIQEKHTLDAVGSSLANIKAHSFTVVDLQPRHKEGGVFVAFEFTASDEEAALNAIKAELTTEGEKQRLPSWGYDTHFWLVEGKPWIEDLRRYPSNFLRVCFDGPDIGEERLYELMRPYGEIRDIREPFPVPAGSHRWARVVFSRMRSASVARNAVHGLEVWAPGAASPTTLRIAYAQHLPDGHKVRDWMLKHPRIAFPIIIFILTGISYTIFDFIRSIMVQAKIENWFHIREYRLYRWIRAKSTELRIFTPRPEAVSPAEEVWKERKQAEAALRTYITEWPSTIAFVHGPQGSGKSHLLNAVLKDTRRNALIIDCRPLQNATSDTQLMKVLARQTGFWPFFSFLGSIHHLIDLASVGLIGQKANLSSTLPEQVREMLAVVRRSLKHVKSSHHRYTIRQIRGRARVEDSEHIHAARSERIQRGTWHDGRLDCVAGNGIVAELGIGDERMGDDNVVLPRIEPEGGREEVDTRRKQKSKAQIAAAEGLPIVVLRNFDARGSSREEIYDVLAEWAAGLVENQLAHVIVISDNRENTKRLAKALPSKPLNTIALHDADAASALAFVKRKLEDADIDLEYTREQVASVERLGGRATDLENLIHKVRNGATVEDAVEDIIYREVNEVRKKAFGDDAEDAKNLPWGREQAWVLFKLLSKNSELPYHKVLLEFPFKGDEAPLRSMEHAELISIGTHNGRPSTIRPGKPVFQAVFERMVNDSIFQATQDIAFNEKVIAAAENTVKACEIELLSLKDIEGRWGGNAASSTRSRYLLSKMHASAMKIEALEDRNSELKKVLTKGG